jgi:MFS family permease
MNIAYSLSAYPFGKLSDRMDHRQLLVTGLVVLLIADLVLALGNHWLWTLVGSVIWGLHMGMTQGLLATMVAHTAPKALRGTAFGFFNLVGGVALFLASAVAGMLWTWAGPALTFYAGAAFCLLTIALMMCQKKISVEPT